MIKTYEEKRGGDFFFLNLTSAFAVVVKKKWEKLCYDKYRLIIALKFGRSKLIHVVLGKGARQMGKAQKFSLYSIHVTSMLLQDVFTGSFQKTSHVFSYHPTIS